MTLFGPGHDSAALRAMLGAIADPLFRGKTWAEAQAALCMDPAEEVEFECYATVQYSCWLFSRMAEFALADDGDGLRAFMRGHLPAQMVAALEDAHHVP